MYHDVRVPFPRLREMKTPQTQTSAETKEKWNTPSALLLVGEAAAMSLDTYSIFYSSFCRILPSPLRLVFFLQMHGSSGLQFAGGTMSGRKFKLSSSAGSVAVLARFPSQTMALSVHGPTTRAFVIDFSRGFGPSDARPGSTSSPLLWVNFFLRAPSSFFWHTGAARYGPRPLESARSVVAF